MAEHRISILCNRGVHRAVEKTDPRGCPGCACGCHPRHGREPDKLRDASYPQTATPMAY